MFRVPRITCLEMGFRFNWMVIADDTDTYIALSVNGLGAARC